MLNRGFGLPIVFIMIILISILVGNFMNHYSTSISKNFFKDLAMSRGYWATFGAKELKKDVSYAYKTLDNKKEVYTIDVFKDDFRYSWKLRKDASGIKDEELWHRVLGIENNKIKFYKRID